MTRRVAALAVGLALAAAGTAAGLTPPWPVPSFAELRASARSSEVRFVDRRGALVHELRGDPEQRSLAWVPLAEVSPPLVETLVRIEDHRFRSHSGVDWLALAGAGRDWVTGRAPRGASTLTMQLARALDPEARAPRRSLAGKLRQLRAALALERRLGKDEVLEVYLNRVTFRGELRGVDAAARGLFGVAPHALDAAQSLALAALLRSPNAGADELAARACRLAPLAAGRVTCGAARSAAFAALSAPPRIRAQIALAPHLARRLLTRDSRPERGVIATTLDADLQRAALAAVRSQLADLSDRNARDAALIVIENATGDVLAYVGSSGPASAAPQVDGLRARRQAGSTLKPFLYALALDARLVTPASWLEDTPLEIGTALGAYEPRDYDERHRGLVTLRAALAGSLNVPAVRTLQLVGPPRLVRALEEAGLTGLRPPEDYGASLALGSADVRLEELANAYRALANGGATTPLRFRRDSPMTEAPRRLVSADAAFLVADILADRGQRGASFGFESSLATPFWSAVKTGTSKDMRDNWCLGFSSDFTVGVWVGNFSGEPMWNVSGVDGAAPLWLELMRTLHRDRPSHAPAPPLGVVRARDEWFLRGTESDAGAPPAPRAARAARIRAPTDGAVLALDPDIPPPAQRLFVESDPPRPDLRLFVDGVALGDAGEPRAWEPAAGRHQVELVDPDSNVVDRVSFRVRD